MKQFLLKLLQTGLMLLSLLFSFPAFACTTCSRPLQAAIFDESFIKLFFLMVLPFAFVWAIVSRLYKLK